MFSRFAGRLVTGRLAFFVAGAVDVAVMFVLYARWRVSQRRARLRLDPPLTPPS